MPRFARQHLALRIAATLKTVLGLYRISFAVPLVEQTGLDLTWVLPAIRELFRADARLVSVPLSRR